MTRSSSDGMHGGDSYWFSDSASVCFIVSVSVFYATSTSTATQPFLRDKNEKA